MYTLIKHRTLPLKPLCSAVKTKKTDNFKEIVGQKKGGMLVGSPPNNVGWE